MNDKYITIRSIYTYLGVSRSTFYRHVCKHSAFARKIKITKGTVRYQFSDLVSYCEDRKIAPPTSPTTWVTRRLQYWSIVHFLQNSMLSSIRQSLDKSLPRTEASALFY